MSQTLSRAELMDLMMEARTVEEVIAARKTRSEWPHLDPEDENFWHASAILEKKAMAYGLPPLVPAKSIE